MCAHEPGNLDEWTNFLKDIISPKFTQEEISNLNMPIFIIEIIITFQNRKHQAQVNSATHLSKK
jgi:hypothetical protein